MGFSCIDSDDGWAPGAFTKPGGFERIGSERKFGVELEYFDVENWDTLEGKTLFGAKHDGSVDGEFYSPIMSGDNGLAECEKFCELAGYLGFSTDPRDSGFHAHFDLRGESVRSLKSIALAYHLTKKYWELLVHPSRVEENRWCNSHRFGVADVKGITDLQDFADFSSSLHRYTWINFCAYNKFGSVEVRSHESTINGFDVVAWITGHCRFIDAASKMGMGKVEGLFERKQVKTIAKEMNRIIDNPLVTSHFADRLKAHACEMV